jgi:hypothetical protein
MSDSDQRFAYSSLVVVLNFLMFFLGIFLIEPFENGIYFNYTFVFITFFIGIFSTVGLSFRHKSLIGGLLLGLSTSSSYWIGFLTGVLITKLYPTSISVLYDYGFYALAVITSFSILGLFFGFLGYISDQLFVEKPVTEVYVFRDYWSNVFSLGKNNRRELNQLDQRLSRRIPWRLDIRTWWIRLIQKILEPKPELVFVHHQVAKSGHKSDSMLASSFRPGDVFDVSSGSRLSSDVIDPLYLVAKYKPSIMNMPAISQTLGGGRKMAVEELVSRALGRFLKSKILWFSYFTVSLALFFSVLSYFESNFIISPVNRTTILVTCLLLSAMTFLFVWRLRRLSLELFEKRPDERILLFSLYLILFLLYGTYYQFIVSIDEVMLNIKTLFDMGVGPWVIWIEWLVVLSVILGLAYIFIHRECEVSNIYFYDRKASRALNTSIFPYKDERDEPIWLREEDDSGLYWVIRFMYYWPYEITVIPHPDWERIEVWVDAKTGEAKWVVSDYHYRELWYKVECDLIDKGLAVSFLTNFHTPIPFVKPDDVEKIAIMLEQSNRNLVKTLLSGKTEFKNALLEEDDPWTKIHPPDWIEKFGLKGVAASFCSKLKWSYWKYPWGIDNIEKYTSEPSFEIEEQPIEQKK